MYCKLFEILGEQNKRINRNQGRLTITYGKPHKEASSDTLSRWINGELSNAGIDVTIFQANSCRAASTSKARQQGTRILEMLKRGCWSKDDTFIVTILIICLLYCPKCETVSKVYSSGYTEVLHVKLVRCEKLLKYFYKKF